ncbi:MAG: class I SAM-dependent methyltransferase [Spirochaetales bacterium]|nr:class I SAM-dependent methyltransferase [Spirochaetales bacterium]
METSCMIYKILIDPLLRSVRHCLKEMIPPGSSVLEMGSGTGAQACTLAGRCGRYLGIDLNPDMTSCAAHRCSKQGYTNTAFKNADGSNLDFITDHEFDIATITLALHAMKHETRMAILSELNRVARKIIIMDYSSPLPRSLAGFFTRSIEKIAGKEHYSGFRDYQQRRGISPLISEAGLTATSERRTLAGIIQITTCGEPQ